MEEPSVSFFESVLRSGHDIISKMKLHSLQLVLGGLGISSSAASTRGQRCAYGDPCWPSESVWQTFNSSISGHLIRTVPSAAVCHNARYDATLCAAARDNWANSFWRTNQTGAYTAIAWELGDEQCFIDSPREAPCQQGLGKYQAVPVKSSFFWRSWVLMRFHSTSLLCRGIRHRAYSSCGSVCAEA
jgi:hypothetical protein